MDCTAARVTSVVSESWLSSWQACLTRRAMRATCGRRHINEFTYSQVLMFRVTRQIDFCYGHRLLNYEGKCKYLHGHNGRAIITIESGQLDQRGMVLDFSDIKRVVSGWIDENLDHRMILHREDPIVAVL